MLSLLAQHPLHCCIMYCCPWPCHCHCCICTTAPSTSVLLPMALPLPLLHQQCIPFSSRCIVLPIALPLLTAALQPSYWEGSNWSTQLWHPCQARESPDAEAPSAASKCSLYWLLCCCNNFMHLAPLHTFLCHPALVQYSRASRTIASC